MPDDISSFTQTYTTTSYTVANPTAVVVATTGAALTAYGYAEAQANAIVTNLNAVIADVAVLRKVLNAVIDEIQNDGIVD